MTKQINLFNLINSDTPHLYNGLQKEILDQIISNICNNTSLQDRFAQDLNVSIGLSADDFDTFISNFDVSKIDFHK